MIVVRNFGQTATEKDKDGFWIFGVECEDKMDPHSYRNEDTAAALSDAAMQIDHEQRWQKEHGEIMEYPDMDGRIVEAYKWTRIEVAHVPYDVWQVTYGDGFNPFED